MTTQTSRQLVRAGAGEHRPADEVSLDYEGRFLRRKLLATASGAELLIDLPETVSVAEGDAFVTTDGARIVVRAKAEPLLEVVAASAELIRIAWHVGNRHMPAQIEAHRLLIRADHVMADLLARLGAEVRPVTAPFSPEGGAYGQGRTHGHSHGQNGDGA